MAARAATARPVSPMLDLAPRDPFGLRFLALTALAAYDAVLTPTLASPPVPVGSLRDDADPERDAAGDATR